MEIDDVRSDLHALKNLYGILQIRGNAQHGLVNESHLDEKSRILLKKLLDGATEQAFQFHAKIMAEQSASSLTQPEKSHEALRRLYSLDSLKTTKSSQNEAPVGTYNKTAGRSESKSQEETPAVPPRKLKTDHTQSRRDRRPCPICNNNHNLDPQNSAAEKKSSDTKMAMPMPKEEHAHPNHSCICRHHHHPLLRRGLSRRRSGNDSAAKETEKKQDISEAAAAAIRRIEDRIPVLRQMERLRLTERMPTPRRTEAYGAPTQLTQPQRMLSQTKERTSATDEILGQSRGKNWRPISSPPLVKDAVHQSTDKMKETRQTKKPRDGPDREPKDERKISPTVETRRQVGSRNDRDQKSTLTKTVGPSTPKKLPDALTPYQAKEVARTKNREEGDRRAARMNQKLRPSMKRKQETGERKKVGPTLESQKSVLHRGRSCKKLTPCRTTAVEVPSRTGSSCTVESTASRTSLSSAASPRSARKKSLPRGMLTHHARRKYSSSSSSSSPRWLLRQPTPSLPRRRAGREKPEKRGRLRRFKDKLAVIFHHHHHHHHHLHHHGGNGDREEESPIPSEDSHRHRSIWNPFGKFHGEGAAAVIRAPCRQEHHHGHLYALLQRFLNHVWHPRTKGEKFGVVGERRERGKKGRVVGVGRNGDKKMGWWQGGGVKLGRRTKPRLSLGPQKAHRNKTQVLCDAKT